MSEMLIPEEKGLYPVQSTDLKARVDEALSCISDVAPVIFQTWNRSHSEVTWAAMNLDHETETRNLREIGSSLQRRRDALSEVHFAHQECLINAQIHQEEGDKLNGAKASKEYLLAKKELAQAHMKHEAILGATKDVVSLKSSYDKIMGRIIEKHGKFDETIFELEEKEYWIKRLMIQAMRDVRECGSIRSGAQRDLEQIGIEPIEALQDIKSYFSNVESSLKAGVTITRDMRDKWANSIFAKYDDRLSHKIERMGQATEHLFRLEK